MAATEGRPAPGQVRTECGGVVRAFVRRCRSILRVARVLLRLRQVPAAAKPLLFDGTHREVRRQESALDFGVVGDTGGKTEQLLVDVEPYRRFVVCRRDQDA